MSEIETERVASTVSKLREIAYDLRQMGYIISAENVGDEAENLHRTAHSVDQRVGRL